MFIVKEDFTDGWVEVDPNLHILRTGKYILDADLTRNEDAHFYKDMGAAYFTDFVHYVDVKGGVDPQIDAVCWVYMLSNDVDDGKGLLDNNKTAIGLTFYDMCAVGLRQLELREIESGNQWVDSKGLLSTATFYYVRIEKSGTSFKCDIYSTEAKRRVGVGNDGDIDTLSLTLHADHSFRYVFAANSQNTGNALQSNTVIENLGLSGRLPRILDMGRIGRALEEFTVSEGEKVFLI